MNTKRDIIVCPVCRTIKTEGEEPRRDKEMENAITGVILTQKEIIETNDIIADILCFTSGWEHASKKKFPVVFIDALEQLRSFKGKLQRKIIREQ